MVKLRQPFIVSGMVPNTPTPINGGPPRFLLGAVGFVFAGIGLTVLGFLWLTPFDTFGSPPLFFRIFGSFIAIIFVIFGGTAAYSAALKGGKPFAAISALSRKTVGGSYVCPHCGGPLQARADVSPSGDVKCTFCNSWFNIHQQQA